jgi:hypothetical protein
MIKMHGTTPREVDSLIFRIYKRRKLKTPKPEIRNIYILGAEKEYRVQTNNFAY